jgi:biotin carboxyl carrier protein
LKKLKYETEIFQQSHSLRIERRDGRILAQVDNRSYELEIRDLGDGSYLLINDSEVHECMVATRLEQFPVFEVHLRGNSYDVKVADPKRLRSGKTAGGHNHGMARIQASMPGKVVRVLVEVGNKVEAGAGVVVVEAMKMQNEMKAPKAGTVVSLTAVAGATVNAGDVLAVIE